MLVILKLGAFQKVDSNIEALEMLSEYTSVSVILGYSTVHLPQTGGESDHLPSD